MMARSTAVVNVDLAERISLVQHSVELLVVVKLDVSAVEAALMAPDCVSIEVENLNLGPPCKVR
jgi:hypothetical protein